MSETTWRHSPAMKTLVQVRQIYCNISGHEFGVHQLVSFKALFKDKFSPVANSPLQDRKVWLFLTPFKLITNSPDITRDIAS